MRDVCIQPIQDDDDNDVTVAHKSHFCQVISLVRILGLIWIVRGILGSLLFVSPASVVAWYGVDISSLDKYHISLLAYIRMIIVAFEIFYGGFLTVVSFFGDVVDVRTCLLINLIMTLFRWLLNLLVTAQHFAKGGFDQHSWYRISVDGAIFDLGAIILSCCSYYYLKPSSLPEASSQTSRMQKIYYVVFGVCFVWTWIYCAMIRPDTWVMPYFLTPDFLNATDGFPDLLKGFLSMLVISYMSHFFIGIMLACMVGSALDYHCYRCIWTWCCANLAGWVALKLYLQSIKMPVTFCDYALGGSVLFALFTWNWSLALERSRAGDIFFRRMWIYR